MSKKQVLTRMSQETYERMQALAEKYGLSASALLVSLVNDRWLLENSEGFERPVASYQAESVTRWDGIVPEPPPNFLPGDPAFAEMKPSRKRHKPKRG